MYTGLSHKRLGTDLEYFFKKNFFEITKETGGWDRKVPSITPRSVGGPFWAQPTTLSPGSGDLRP